MHSLEIKDLVVSVENKKVLNGVNLTIKSGEIHAIMGPNGTGKSTLAKTIMGDNSYKIESGDILLDGTSILSLSVYERANLGLFLGMQMPLEIEGVTNADFLRSALSNKEKDKFNLMKFIKKLDNEVENLGMSKEMIHRGINIGFSGGERKKNEILQMYMLEPNMVMLDEIDSGLDVDSLKTVGNASMKYFNDYKPGVLVITHYQRLLDYIKPTHVHILEEGKIVKSGDFSLVKEIETMGYKKDKINGTCIVKEFLNNE